MDEILLPQNFKQPRSPFVLYDGLTIKDEIFIIICS